MHSESVDAAALLDTVIGSRKSVRAFQLDPVPKQHLVEILDAARAAPSNFNSQPWRVYVLTGEAKRALGDTLLQAHVAQTVPLFSPFPQTNPPECAARVDDFGRRLYASVGVDRSDMAGRARVSGRNFVFFDAPVGMIFTIHAALTKHSWLDFGLFLQTLMLAAQVRGLSTCPQVSFALPVHHSRAVEARSRRVGDLRNVVRLRRRGSRGQSIEYAARAVGWIHTLAGVRRVGN